MNRDLPHPRSARRRKGTLFAAAALSLALLAGFAPVRALGDELDLQRKQLNAEIQKAKSKVSQYSTEVADAVTRYENSKNDLAAAEAYLAKTEADLRSAEDDERQKVAELEAAEASLKSAIAEVDAAKESVASEKRRITALVRDEMVSSNSMLEISMLLDDLKTGDINNRVQFSSAIFNARSVKLDRLHELQFALEAAQNKAEAARKLADDLRQAAAAQVAKTKGLRQQAADARSNVASLVQKNAGLKTSAEKQLSTAKTQLEKMEADSVALDKRIAERVRLKRLEEERLARELAKQNKPGQGGQTGNPPVASNGLYWPAHGPAGSPFGMRLHPILGYYRMHWGTDIGAACGSPLYAAHNGVVTERYYNSGYGHRLVIDIGKYNGSYLSIGYAHATHYVVSVGQRVSKGQIVGYVGTTGLSTGCHLHLEVWANGAKVDPMKWF